MDKIVKVGGHPGFDPPLIYATDDNAFLVEWRWIHGSHSVTADDGSFDSGVLCKGDTFQHVFGFPGTYGYHCTLHGGRGGVGMSGKVTVVPRRPG